MSKDHAGRTRGDLCGLGRNSTPRYCNFVMPITESACSFQPLAGRRRVGKDLHRAQMAAFCLDMHANYRCRHSGACCTAGWAIPAEPAVVKAVQARFHAAVASGFSRTEGSGPQTATRRLFVTADFSPEAPAVVATAANGACVFFDEAHGRLCAIHMELGPELLPSACRQFPRVALTDDRGTRVSLSHFCPTAGAMLFSDRPLRRVNAPPSLTLDGSVEGLDARGVLPPLIRPGLLTDGDGYDAWEAAGLRVLSRDDLSPDQALGAIDQATRDIEAWRPEATPLAAHVELAFDRARIPDDHPPTYEDSAQRVACARDAVPAGLTLPPDLQDAASRWQAVFEYDRPNDRVVRRYLAARLFGSWIAYSGRGLRTIVESLRVHLAVLRFEVLRRANPAGNPRDVLLEAIRATDLLLVHYADSRALARLIDSTS